MAPWLKSSPKAWMLWAQTLITSVFSSIAKMEKGPAVYVLCVCVRALMDENGLKETSLVLLVQWYDRNDVCFLVVGSNPAHVTFLVLMKRLFMSYSWSILPFKTTLHFLAFQPTRNFLYTSFLGSGPVGDDDLWHHHIGKFSLFLFPSICPPPRLTRLDSRPTQPVFRLIQPVLIRSKT